MRTQYDVYPMMAYVRGHAAKTGAPCLSETLLKKPLFELCDEEMLAIFQAGREAGLKLYRFKNTHDDLPRVRRVMGFLKSIYFETLLDVGSGRGVFLFPFMNTFPHVKVTSADILPHRVAFLQEVSAGGMDCLSAMQGDVCDIALSDGAFDVVTLLEVLEHIPDVEAAIRNAVRLARQYVVVSVPSKEDDNPEHIHLLTKERLTVLFGGAGCDALRFDGVNGHLIMMARKGESAWASQ